MKLNNRWSSRSIVVMTLAVIMGGAALILSLVNIPGLQAWRVVSPMMTLAVIVGDTFTTSRAVIMDVQVGKS